MPKYLFILIGIGFLVTPLADQRALSLLPLYILDYIAFALITISLFMFWKQRKNYKCTQLSIWIGLGIFFLSTLASFLLHDPTLTGLGQLKSWILLPAGAAFLGSFVLQEYQYRDRIFLCVLFAALCGLILILIPYLVLDIRTFDNRLQGPFASPNFLAFFLMIATVVAVHFWYTSSFWSHKVFFSLIGCILLFLLFLTHSFGAWLALFGGVSWYFFRAPSLLSKKKMGALALILIILGIFVITEITQGEKLENILEERSSLASRITIWSVAGRALGDSPISGIGIGRFQEVYLSYQPLYPPYLEWAVPQPHNLFLALWLQTGLLGLIISLFFLCQALFAQSTLHSRTLQALFVGIVAYGIFDTPLFGNALAFLFWFILAFLLFSKKSIEKSPQE